MIYNYNKFLFERKRLDFLANKFVDILGQDIFDKLIALDPTKNNSYSHWVLNLYLKKKLKKEDFYKVTEYLTEFEKVKNKLDNKDINFYKSLPDLVKVLKDVGGSGKASEDENYLLTDKYFINNGDAKIFAEDKDYLIVIPHTLEASKFYGKDTEWCTLYPDMFDAYTELGELYIIIDKNKLNTDDANRRLQFNFSGTKEDSESQFMNMYDHQVGSKIKKKFIKYFEDKEQYGFVLNYDYVDTFWESETTVGLNGKVGIINDLGKIIIPIIYDSIGNFDNLLAPVELNGKWGFVNEDGDVVVPIKYDEVLPFMGGKYIKGRIKGSRAKVSLNDKWGIIDNTGKEITPIKYDKLGNFEEGNGKLATFFINFIPGRVDKSGKEYNQEWYSEKKKKYREDPKEGNWNDFISDQLP